jgi:hypothetical protein
VLVPLVSSHSGANDADRRGIPGGGRRESLGTVSRTLPLSDGTIRLEPLAAATSAKASCGQCIFKQGARSVLAVYSRLPSDAA